MPSFPLDGLPSSASFSEQHVDVLLALVKQVEELEHKLTELNSRIYASFSLNATIQEKRDFQVLPRVAPQLLDEDKGPEGQKEELNQRSSTMTEIDVEKYVVENGTYTFTESLWEVTLLLGLSEIPILEHVVSLCLLLFNCFMQGFICWILADTRIRYLDGGRVDVARAWRMESGHRDSLADSRGHSIVTRMCSGAPLEVSGQQQWEYETADEYLEDFQGWPVGGVVCCWCLCVWALIVFAEMRHAAERAMALFGRVTKSYQSELLRVGDAITLHSIGSPRFMLILLFSAIRFIVVFSVFMAGTVWLSTTDEVSELILNAAALAFILDLDELLYAVACPKSVKALLGSLEPIRLQPSLQKVPLNFLGAVLFIAVYFVSLVPTLLHDHVAELEDIWNVYCGNEKDFIIGVNPSTGIYYTYYYYDADVQDDEWLQKISSQIVHQTPTKMFIKETDYMEFRTRVSSDLLGAVWELGKCQDWEDDNHTFQGMRDRFYEPALLRALPHYTAISDCGSINTSDCSIHPVVRLACAKLCGCESFVSAQFHIQGCPLATCKDTDSFQLQRQAARQFDVEPQSLSAMPEWNMYWDESLSFLKTQLTQYGVLNVRPTDLYSTFKELGCDAFKYFSDADIPLEDFLCQSQVEDALNYAGLVFRPLRPFCPQSCGCASGGPNYRGMYCPYLAKDEDRPDNELIACAGLHVSGGSLLMSSSCRQTVPVQSTPAGFYRCIPFGYNGKHAYEFEDSEGTIWAIKWETVANLDWGPRFLGKGLGLQSKSKWVLVSMRSHETKGFGTREQRQIDVNEGVWRFIIPESDSQLRAQSYVYKDQQRIVARFFAEGSDALAYSPGWFPPESNWFPRNVANSDADCAAGNLTTEGADWYAVGEINTDSCPPGHTWISSYEKCLEAGTAMGFYVGWMWEDEDPDPDLPKGCFTTHDLWKSISFNYANTSGSSCTECALVCTQSSKI